MTDELVASPDDLPVVRPMIGLPPGVAGADRLRATNELDGYRRDELAVRALADDPAGSPEVDRHGIARLTSAEQNRVLDLAAQSLSAKTRAAYRSDWTRWEQWCEGRCAAKPADPTFVALYVETHAALRASPDEWKFSPATLTRWVSSLNHANRTLGARPPGEHPVVRAVLAAVRRSRRSSGPRRRTPLLLDDLSRLVTTINDSARSWPERVAARRDVAVLTVGWAGAFRRSELESLELSDVSYHSDDGLHVRLARSKTDQEGKGQLKALPFGSRRETCPVCAVLAWVEVVQAWDAGGRPQVMKLLRQPDSAEHVCRPGWPIPRSTNTLFRSVHRSGRVGAKLSGHAINEMIRRRAQAAGIDPTVLHDVGGHSLRAGFVTQAFRAEATAEAIARQTGHKSYAVLATYQREGAPLMSNAVTRVGL